MEKNSEMPTPIMGDANITRRRAQLRTGKRSADFVTTMMDGIAEGEFAEAQELANKIKANMGKLPENVPPINRSH